jgi:homoserine kinase type II
VAVYTPLSDPFIQTMCAVYPGVGAPTATQGIPHGSINTTYRVQTDSGVWYLRVNEGKDLRALLVERDVLDALQLPHARARLPAATPTMARSVAGGVFFPFEAPDGTRRRACLFPALPGRDLGVFEVTPAHTAAIGAFLGQAHQALRATRVGRGNPYGVGWLNAALRRAHHQSRGGPHAQVVDELHETIVVLQKRRRPLPRGLVHGDLFPDNTKWRTRTDGAPALAAVFDWEMAGRDHLLWDVAVAIVAWCFGRDSAGAPTWEPARATALLTAYEQARPLVPSERRGLQVELGLVAARFTLSRLLDFELSPPKDEVGAERRYLDHQDMQQRLRVFLQAPPVWRLPRGS